MLEFNHVSAQYGKIQALHDVSLSVRKGEIVTLIGANGAGKTTLLSTLCGEPRATTGRSATSGRTSRHCRRRRSCVKTLHWCRKGGACSGG